ncbi:MAG: hypothetical protein Q9167_005873 [Letrouitia subvulpina]
MDSYLFPYATFFFVVAVIGVIYSIVTKAKQYRLARRWGCKPLRSPEWNDPLGLRSIIHIHKARAEQLLPVKLGQSMDDIGPSPHTAQRRFLWHRQVMTRDPENIKTVLNSHASDFELGVARGIIATILLGPSLLTKQGQPWKHARSFIRPQFRKESISNFALFETHLQELLQRFHYNDDGWCSSQDLQVLFNNMTLDIITQFLFGQSVKSQNTNAQAYPPSFESLPSHLIQDFPSSLDVASHWVMKAVFLGYLYWILPNRQFKMHRSRIRRFIEWYADRAVECDQTEKGPEEGGRFILLNELARLTSNKLVLRDETLGLILAGRSTTAAALSFLFYYLARKPDVYLKLRSAIHERFGDGESDPTNIDLAKLEACEYLQHCIDEGLRLGSPTSLTAREASRDTMLPRGGGPDGEAPIFVAKGTRITVDIFGLHHREDIWGQDVEEFRPERWENRERGFDFIPFGVGPRACIGRKLLHELETKKLLLTKMAEPLARTELAYLTARLVQIHDGLQAMDTANRPKYDLGITNKVAKGVHLKFHRSAKT